MPSDSEVVSWLKTQPADVSGNSLGAGYQAVVSVLDSPYGQLVIKRGRAGVLFGRASVSREYEVYRRLRDIPGIPKTYGLMDHGVLIIEYINGQSLRDRESTLKDKETFYAGMLQTIQAMHAAGVAHGDLKRKDNTLVGPDEKAFLIDFGIATTLRSGFHPLNKIWYHWMRQMDYNAWIKLKYGRNPTDISPADSALYKPLWIERIARWIRVPWQKITLRRARQRWRKHS